MSKDIIITVNRWNFIKIGQGSLLVVIGDYIAICSANPPFMGLHVTP